MVLACCCYQLCMCYWAADWPLTCTFVFSIMQVKKNSIIREIKAEFRANQVRSGVQL